MNPKQAIEKIQTMPYRENRDSICVAFFSELHCELCKRKTKSVFVNLLGQGLSIDACPSCQVLLETLIQQPE